MDRHERFKRLSRQEQRRNLLRRLNRIRREIEQTLRDRASYNDMRASRGLEGIGDDPQLVRMLAEVDQEIKEVRDSRPPE